MSFDSSNASTDEQQASPIAQSEQLLNQQEIDAAALHHLNQKLVQQLDVQKQKLHDLEAKIKEMKGKQTSYHNVLIRVNQLWNQLVDDLIILGVRAGEGEHVLKIWDRADALRGSIPSCFPEEIFLCRLLEKDSISTTGSGIVEYVEEALTIRQSSTKELMKFVEEAIDDERSKLNIIEQNLQSKVSAEDAILQLTKFEDIMREKAEVLRRGIDVLQQKHKEYVQEIESYVKIHSEDQSEIEHLEGELEDSISELEESRRKLIDLKMQKDASFGLSNSSPSAVNGNLSPEKPADKMMRLRELKDSIEETKILASNRLSELSDAREHNAAFLKRLQNLQNESKDDKHVIQSKLYALLNDQIQHSNAELERYKALTEALQAERPFVIRREKELNAKEGSADAAKNAIDHVESRIVELELQLQRSIMEKNELEVKMEEAVQDSGRKDIKSEFRIMAAALSKELRMMESQLNRWKNIAHEALSLHEAAQTLRASLTNKSNEQKSLVDKCAKQGEQIKDLKAEIEKLQKEKSELQIILDMYGNECYDNRDAVEIRESTRRAKSQAEALGNALEEHSLELRVKAANEAEDACQQRLSAAEAEIADLRAKLDASERDVAELSEAIKLKDAEAEAYISEIETIGQAYDDMQTQNQHLLQQVTERDDYNIKLVSDSVKIKQAQNSLLSEKQELTQQLQQVNLSIENLKSKISQNEDQMKGLLTEAIKCSQEDRHLTVNLEAAKWELADAEKELKWLKSAYASSEKEYDQLQRDMNEVQIKLETERDERKKLEEELAEWNRKVAELTAETGEAAIQRLQDEIRDCRAILKCSVCLDRPKEVVIVKCYHLFCNQCIQRNLEIRHRKCPGCGTPFGQNDVRFVKI